MSWQAILVALVAAAICVSVLSNGLSTGQILFLLLLIILVTIVRKGNDATARKISIAFRDDIDPPPFGDVHILSLWSVIPIFVLSAYFPWLAAALVAGLLLVFVKPAIRLFAAGKTGQLLRQNAVRRLKAEPVDVIFYVSGPENSGYQINQWIPVAEKLGVGAAIVIRNFGLLNETDETSLPVYYLRTIEDVETFKDLCGARVFLYPANFKENVQSLRHPEIQHYFINHGESDKVVNQSKLLMAYDKLLVAGPMAKDRLAAAGLPLRDNQVEYVGRPQIEIFLEKVEEPGPIKKILYAPTWEGFVKEADYSSVSDFGLKMLEQILSNRELEVVVKPHPFTGSRLASTRAALNAIGSLAERYPNLRVLGHEHKIYPQMNWCDLMIADIGSVVNDFLATGKPVIVTSVKGVPLDLLHKNFPTTRGTYVIEDPSEAGTLLATISKADPMAEPRSEVRRHSLGDIPEGSLARFEKVIRAGIQAGQLGNGSAIGTN